MTRRRAERGMTLVMVAVCLATFLALAALAIDLGLLFTARTSAQHAADAAALAGAYTFSNPKATQPDAAVIAAKNVAAKNAVLGTNVSIADGNVTVDTANRRVTVSVPRTGANGIPLYFASIFSKLSGDVAATATAECSKYASGTRCLKPIYIPTTMLSTAKTPKAACNAGEVIYDNSGQFTAFAQARIGNEYPIRPTDPNGAWAPGQFYSLDFGAGGNTYRCTLGNCLSDCGVDTQVARCGDSFPLKTGNMVGPTTQGVGDLIGDTPDTWVAVDQYRHTDGKLYDSSHQLVLAPVWNDCTQNISSGYKGQEVTVVGFVELFVEGMDKNGNVMARLVSPLACNGPGSSGTGSANGANTGPLGIPIRLVRTQAQ